MTPIILGLGARPSLYVCRRVAVAAALAAGIISPVHAGSELKLDDAIRLAVDSNPTLKQYPLRYDLLTQRKQTASLKPALKIGADIENVAGTNSYTGLSAAESTLSIFSVLERGNKRNARIDEIDQQFNVVELERHQAVVDIAADIAQQFISLAAAQERVTIWQSAVTLQQNIKREVRKRVDSGAAPDAELLRAKSILAERIGQFEASKSDLAIERNRLSSFWQVDSASSFRVSTSLFQLPEPLDFDELENMVTRNPDVALLNQKIVAQDGVITRVSADSAADVGWRLGLRNFAETDDVALSLGLEIPLFSGRRSGSAASESRIEKQGLQLQRDQAIWDFKRRLRGLNQQLLASNAETETLRDKVLPLQQQALTETQRAYNRGRYSFAELAAEQSRLNELRHQALNAAKRSHHINIELERLLGQTTPSSVQ